jgi:hypothetical protein
MSNQPTPPHWTALYLPARAEGEPNPSRFDLESKDAAWEFVYSQMCQECKDEWAKALAGDDESSVMLGCACEWLVLTTADFEAAKNLEDLQEAAGWKVIYQKS